ncbi:unnamed protein product [Owenia fusiformis]|uniref:FAS1 domain-containing protein n=1 Tax=Owenia fusiformis TaxID=6347 RepID=A0A8S4P900_OWEFU|nr:unnamed protein product [Owenia fusiformis]
MVDRTNIKQTLQGTQQYMFFAPNDTVIASLSSQARQRINSLGGEDLLDKIKYHMVLIGTSTGEAGTILDQDMKRSMARNSPPLFFARENFMGKDHQYVNGARIEKIWKASNGAVYVIDRIFWEEPSKQSAWGFLTKPDVPNVLDQFNKFESLFTKLGGFEDLEQKLNDIDDKLTLFLPQDDYIPSEIMTRLDREGLARKDSLMAHIIPHKVYYSSMMRDMEEIETMKTGDQITFRQIYNRDQNIFDTYVSNRNGLAKIIKGNITVMNGVVHIIDKYMWYIPEDYTSSLVLNQEPEGSEFSQLLAKDERIKDELNDLNRVVTTFVPTPAAFEKLRTAASEQGSTAITDNDRYRVRVANFETNRTALEYMLKLHIVEGVRLTSREIRLDETTARSQAGYVLRFRHFENDTYIDGGHQTAKIIESKMDIGTSNGYIHYIDTVLGFPYRTAKQEIEQNPRLNLLHEELKLLQEKDPNKFNLLEILGDTNRRFTIFAPNNTAFERILNLTCLRYEEEVCADYGKSRQATGTGALTGQDEESSNNYNAQWNTDPFNQDPYNNRDNEGQLVDDRQQELDDLNNRQTNEQFGQKDQTQELTYQQRAAQQLLLDNRKRAQLNYVLERLVVENPAVYLDNLPQGDSKLYTMSGEQITVYKRGETYGTDNFYQVRFGNAVARIVHADIGVLNGVVHIVDPLLFEPQDLMRVSGASYTISSILTVLLSILAAWGLIYQS